MNVRVLNMQTASTESKKISPEIEKAIKDRRLVYRLLFTGEFHLDVPSSRLFRQETEAWEETHGESVEEKYYAIIEHREEIDELLSCYAEKWKVSRLSPSTRSILRLSVYEMLWGSIPPQISINEAVEIAKEYDTEQSQRFINGILNRIAREKGLITDPPSDTSGKNG